MENKQKICDLLCDALRLTDAYGDIEMIEYSKSNENVAVIFKGGYTRNINVAMDSGMNMIRDIVHCLE
jgi:hypothetical protein